MIRIIFIPFKDVQTSRLDGDCVLGLCDSFLSFFNLPSLSLFSSLSLSGVLASPFLVQLIHLPSPTSLFLKNFFGFVCHMSSCRLVIVIIIIVAFYHHHHWPWQYLFDKNHSESFFLQEWQVLAPTLFYMGRTHSDILSGKIILRCFFFRFLNESFKREFKTMWEKLLRKG